MAMQSLSHSCTKEINKALCSTSKMCDFFAWRMIIPDKGMFPFFVVFMVLLLGNCTVVPLCVSFIYVRTSWYSVQH